MFYEFFRKFKDAAFGVVPITLLVIAVNFIVSPMGAAELFSFISGALLLILGLTLYSIGSGQSVEFMGGLIGAEVSKSKSLPLILAVCGSIGVIVTVAEPDLSVLAGQVGGIPNFVLIGAVALGVGAFMLVAVLRLVLKIDLKWVLFAFYGVIFILAFIIPREFLPLSFDSSGVTTGPVTVPFIMALGAALSVALGGKDSQDSSFGIVGICSIGPIFAVMILSLVTKLSVEEDGAAAVEITTAGGALLAYLSALPEYLKDMAISLAPILVFFLIYNFASFRLGGKRLIRTLVGALYVYVGLTIFLLGANVGFLPAGRRIGEMLAGRSPDMLIIMGVAVGTLIVLAEPAIQVLTKQVEEVTGGVIKKSAMTVAMCVSMAISVGLSMLRIVFDLDLKVFLVAGYGLALALTFFVPKIFTGIAFDSGGVASGAMTAAFLLPMASGATYAIYGADNPDINLYVMTDAFGCVALVAMTPLIAIQVLGLVFSVKTALGKRQPAEDFSRLLSFEGEVMELGGFTSADSAVDFALSFGRSKRAVKPKKGGENGNS